MTIPTGQFEDVPRRAQPIQAADATDNAGHKSAAEAQALLASIVESSDDAILTKTLDGVIRTWNRGAERIFGYTREEAVGRPITLIIPPELIDEERAILDRLRGGERIDHFETVRVTKDGRRVDISLTVSPIRDHDGRIVGASKVARDVTERRRVEEIQAQLGAIVESSDDAIISKSLDGVIRSWNVGAERLFGYALSEALGQHITLIIPPDRYEEEREILTRLRRGERIEHFETVRRTKGGKAIDLSITVSPIRDRHGRVVGASKVARDITERKLMDQALRDADRRKDDFIAMLAHELRNPLAPIRNGVQVMRLTSGDPTATARSLEMMGRQLDHMVRLVDDLLDIARLNRNKMELRRSSILLMDVVSAVVESAGPIIESQGHELTVSMPGTAVHLDGDLTRLSQVFGNLLTNSAKYTERGGRIWLAAECRGADVVVSVRDTGIGIPADSLAGVFDMFSQVDRSIERATGGLGIGLSLVKGLVEMHGGTVTAASEGLGRGSTFTVTLPVLACRPGEAAGSGRRQARPWLLRRILVADDNRDGADSLSQLLEILGHQVKTVYDGVEAVEEAERFRPDVVLMDVGMPRLNGYEATRRIREHDWGVRITIIALTGWGQDGDKRLSQEAGCNGHLTKPVSIDDLQSKLEELSGTK